MSRVQFFHRSSFEVKSFGNVFPVFCFSAGIPLLLLLGAAKKGFHFLKCFDDFHLYLVDFFSMESKKRDVESRGDLG